MKPKKPGRSLRVADQIARDLAVLIPKEEPKKLTSSSKIAIE